MLAIFVVTATGTLLWAVPWFPWGFTEDDYEAKDLIPIGLIAGAWLSAFGVVYLRDRSIRYEQTLVTASSVRDGLGTLHSTDYLYDRITIECMRSEHSEVPFGVFAARFGAGDKAPPVELSAVLEAISRLVRQSDSLATLGRQEAGVVCVAMSGREAPAFAFRLKSLLERTVGAADEEAVSVGWAIWGVDGRDPESLIGQARTSMQRKATTRELGIQASAQPEQTTEPEAADESSSIIDISTRKKNGKDVA
jgi:GGDEF domain-containing protein